MCDEHDRYRVMVRCEDGETHNIGTVPPDKAETLLDNLMGNPFFDSRIVAASVYKPGKEFPVMTMALGWHAVVKNDLMPIPEPDTQAEDSFIEFILDNEDGVLSEAIVCGHLFLAYCRYVKRFEGVPAEQYRAWGLAENLIPDEFDALPKNPSVLMCGYAVLAAVQSAVDNGAPEFADWTIEYLISAISNILPNGEYAAWVDNHRGVIARFALAERYQ